MPEFYYITKNIMVCPPLDGLQTSEIFYFDPEYASIIKPMSFASQLKPMVLDAAV